MLTTISHIYNKITQWCSDGIRHNSRYWGCREKGVITDMRHTFYQLPLGQLKWIRMIKGISPELLLCIAQPANQTLLSVYHCKIIIHRGGLREVSIYGYPKCFICKNYKWKIWHLVRNVDLLIHKFAPLIFMYFLNCALLLSILFWNRLTINI